jgi:hypothetical protein
VSVVLLPPPPPQAARNTLIVTAQSARSGRSGKDFIEMSSEACAGGASQSAS